MTISGIKSAKTSPKVEATRDMAAPKPGATRAVVPVEHTERSAPLRNVRPDASFVAHLIAMADHAPQTRALRRETPAVAQATYGRTMVSGANSYGRVFSQVA